MARPSLNIPGYPGNSVFLTAETWSGTVPLVDSIVSHYAAFSRPRYTDVQRNQGTIRKPSEGRDMEPSSDAP